MVVACQKLHEELTQDSQWKPSLNPTGLEEGFLFFFFYFFFLFKILFYLFVLFLGYATWHVGASLLAQW